MKHLLTTIVLLLWAIAAPSARACWDGHLAEYKNVTVYGGDDAWSRERARELALWLPRIQALYGDADPLEIYVDSADTRVGEVLFDTDRMDRIFVALADALTVDAAGREEAMQAGLSPLTIQVAATRDRARAEALVERMAYGDAQDPLYEGLFEEHGYYEAGGFPAENVAAHILERDDPGGTVCQVVVGAFLEREEAQAVAHRLSTRFAVRAFVRPL